MHDIRRREMTSNKPSDDVDGMRLNDTIRDVTSLGRRWWRQFRHSWYRKFKDKVVDIMVPYMLLVFIDSTVRYPSSSELDGNRGSEK